MSVTGAKRENEVPFEEFQGSTTGTQWIAALLGSIAQRRLWPTTRRPPLGICRLQLQSGGRCVEDVLLSNGKGSMKRKRPTIAVLPVIQQSGLISSVNSPSFHARAMAASRRVRSW